MVFNFYCRNFKAWEKKCCKMYHIPSWLGLKHFGVELEKYSNISEGGGPLNKEPWIWFKPCSELKFIIINIIIAIIIN